MTATKKTCTECRKRFDWWDTTETTRRTLGNYRRAGSRCSTTVCRKCVTLVVELVRAERYAGGEVHPIYLKGDIDWQAAARGFGIDTSDLPYNAYDEERNPDKYRAPLTKVADRDDLAGEENV